MLYESLSQPIIFFYIILGGFFSGFLFDLKNIFLFKLKNKFFKQFFIFFFTLITLFVYFFINLRFNYGQFRFFIALGFTLAFSMQRFLMVNFVANSVIKCYDKIKGKQNEKKS